MKVCMRIIRSDDEAVWQSISLTETDVRWSGRHLICSDAGRQLPLVLKSNPHHAATKKHRPLDGIGHHPGELKRHGRSTRAFELDDSVTTLDRINSAWCGEANGSLTAQYAFRQYSRGGSGNLVFRKFGLGGTSSVCFSVSKATSLDAFDVESETPRASRGWGMGKGYPLPSRLGDPWKRRKQPQRDLGRSPGRIRIL